ncbi:AAA family ATPase [Winogradskyella sediminis]|uniref:AAA family ATPase n=1 Tax=Winogradskyella sediminis TaxID=1382466 RepID=UPI000AFBF438|nr:AAA family ATPase [Winogradskyella sediminis]
MKLQQAKRHQVKLRLGLSGASGFGKSYSALLLAFGITNDWSKIAVIDTENGSASLYSHLGNYNVLSLLEPFSPERYIEAIKTCENASIEVIIIDSISHEWSGKGGCLQIHEQLGGRFQDWAKLTPRHTAFIDAILQSKCHVITTVRKKIDYSMDRDSNGKTKVIKHGLKDITREGFSYELTVDFEVVNESHLVKASKDRTGLFMDKPEFVINASTGKKTYCLV